MCCHRSKEVLYFLLVYIIQDCIKINAKEVMWKTTSRNHKPISSNIFCFLLINIFIEIDHKVGIDVYLAICSQYKWNDCSLSIVNRLKKQYWKVWLGVLIHLCGMLSISAAARFLSKRYFSGFTFGKMFLCTFTCTCVYRSVNQQFKWRIKENGPCLTVAK